MYKISENFTDEEYNELQWVLGEYVRLTRDSVRRYVKAEYKQSNDQQSNLRYNIAKNLLDKIGAAVKI